MKFTLRKNIHLVWHSLRLKANVYFNAIKIIIYVFNKLFLAIKYVLNQWLVIKSVKVNMFIKKTKHLMSEC